jgi:GntR family transcriptional regulator
MIETILTRLANAQSTQAPKYQALRAAILEAISSGEWAPGARLPSEAELAQSLPYSLGTIQKAYGELVRGGLIERARGRGSFVAPEQRQMAEPWHCRFLADDGSVLPIYPRLLGHEVAEKDSRWTQLFGPHTKIVRLDRSISVNREFEVLSRFFTPQAIARPLLRLPRDKVETANFKTILLRELGMPIRRITQTIAMPDPKRWRRLGIRSQPHLLIEAIAYTADGAAYFQEFYVPANIRKLLFDSDLRP